MNKTRTKSVSAATPAIASAVVSTDFPNLLTAAEAAKLLRTTPGTLAQWRFHQRYPALRWVKIGASVRYKENDIRNFIEGGASR